MKEILKDKKIVLGVTGSIAAFKAPLIVRELIKNGADVHVIMTQSACQFVTPLIMANLSRNKVIIDMFDKESQTSGAWHIHLAHECDLMLIAPCSATTMGKIAHGICDNPLVTVATALPKNIPLVISPAMDSTMWLNNSTQRNLQQLKDDGYFIIPPVDGDLSSGLVGPGRFPEIDDIINSICNVFKDQNLINPPDKVNSDLIDKPLESLQESIDKDKFNAELELELLKRRIMGDEFSGKKILITAGPTIEKIDDVRFISNFSTGKMGFALAEAAQQLGFSVTLVSGPVNLETPKGVNRIDVQTADEMYNEVLQHLDYNVAIMSAAVADFTPKEPFDGKIKKEDINSEPKIELVRTKDILKELGIKKQKNQILVGFALESKDGLENATKKMESKNCDLIVLNMANENDSGFGGNNNTISLLDKNGSFIKLPTLTKLECAYEILNYVKLIFKNN